MAELPPRQQQFITEYLVDLCATQAAIRAGYSAKTAYSKGHALLKLPAVKEAIAEAQAERRRQLGITEDRVLREYAKIAFADARDYMSWGKGGVILLDSSELTPEQAAAVAEVAEHPLKDGGVAVRLKLHDKKGALDALSKHMGLFVERVEHTGKNGGPIQQEEVFTFTLQIADAADADAEAEAEAE